MNCPVCDTRMKKADYGTSGDDPRGHWTTHEYIYECPKCDYQEAYEPESDD